MKRALFLISCLLAFPLLMLAQNDKAPLAKKTFQFENSVVRNTPSNPTMNALFDVQFDHVLNTSGCAGIAWTGSGYWVSKWASDTIYEVDTAGTITNTFTVAGVTGIRGMAFDGTSIYAGINSTSIKQIDLATKTVTGTITAPISVRGIAYDSTANGGAGGLWVANYATDISLLDLAGNVLNSIPAASHGLTSMYSIAFDPYSSGGPYIWAFDQNGGTQQFLYRINIASGTTDLTHDVSTEISGGGIAGGLSVVWGPNPTAKSLIGISQANPTHLFGLELSDYALPAYDASADTLNFSPQYLSIPDFLVSPITWELVATNNGANQIDTLYGSLTVNDGSTDVINGSTYVNNVPSLTSSLLSFAGSYSPTAQGAYTTTAVVSTGLQTDLVNTNDTISYVFYVTDTIMGRDDGNVLSTIGFTNGSEGIVGQLFEIPTLAYATSATFALGSPTLGDSIKIELYDLVAGVPTNVIASSATYFITAADTGGVVLTLPLLNAPVQLAAGSYVLGLHQYINNLSLAYGEFNFHPNSTWVYLAGNGWQPSEAYNFNIVLLLRMNIWSQNMVGVQEASNAVFSVYPSPSKSQFWLDLPNAGSYSVTVSDVQGNVVYSNVLNGQRREAILTNGWANGVYITKVVAEGRSYFAKTVVAH